MSKFTLVLDSSQIATYLECPQQWYYQYNQRLYPLAVQDTSAMDAGTYGHKLLDIYYKSKILSPMLSLNDRIELCYAYDPDIDTCECGCTLMDHTRIQALALEECQRCRYCLSFRPKPFPLSQDIRYQVRNRFKDYLLRYQTNDFMPYNADSVEVGFSHHLYEDEENLFILEGRIDLLGVLQGLDVVVDHKFQLATHYLYPKSVQFKNYALVCGARTLVINYVRLGKVFKDAFLERVLVNFTLPELEVWKIRLIKMFFRIKEAIQSNSYQQNWATCKGFGKTYNQSEPKYCMYTQLCEEIDKRTLETKKDVLYKVREEIWRPW